MSDWRQLLAETENSQSHPFNPLNAAASSQMDNLRDKKDKKDHFVSFENQMTGFKPDPQNPQNPVCGGNSADIADSLSPRQLVSVAPSPQAEPDEGRSETRSIPRFTPGQHILITDNLNRVRASVIQFAEWNDKPMGLPGWWYCLIDADGLLSETHESRISDAGLTKKVSR